MNTSELPYICINHMRPIDRACIHTHTRVRAHTHTHTHTYTHTHIYTRIHACAHTHTYTSHAPPPAQNTKLQKSHSVMHNYKKYMYTKRQSQTTAHTRTRAYAAYTHKCMHAHMHTCTLLLCLD